MKAEVPFYAIFCGLTLNASLKIYVKLLYLNYSAFLSEDFTKAAFQWIQRVIVITHYFF